jgi:MFS family permease
MILFFEDKGLTFTQIGALYAIREILRNLLEIPAGIVADAMGRRRIMMISFLFYIASFIVFSISGAYTLFIGAMILYSIGDAFRTGTHKAMILDYLKLNSWSEHKVHYYGHTRSWSQKGSAVSSLIAGAMIYFSGTYSLIFIYAAIPYILNLINIWSYPGELDGKITKFEGDKVKDKYKKVWQEFKTAFSQIRVFRAISSTAIYSSYYQAVKDYLQPVLQSLALSAPILLTVSDQRRTAVVVGVVFFIIYMLTSYTSKNAGKFASRFQSLTFPLNITLFVGLGTGIISGVFYYFGYETLAIIFYVAIYLIENLRKPIGVGYVAEQLDQDILASALSAESQLKSLYAAGIALLLGYTSDLWGVGMALSFCTTILLVFSVLVFLIRKKRIKSFG